MGNSKNMQQMVEIFSQVNCQTLFHKKKVQLFNMLNKDKSFIYPSDYTKVILLLLPKTGFLGDRQIYVQGKQNLLSILCRFLYIQKLKSVTVLHILVTVQEGYCKGGKTKVYSIQKPDSSIKDQGFKQKREFPSETEAIQKVSQILNAILFIRQPPSSDINGLLVLSFPNFAILSLTL